LKLSVIIVNYNVRPFLEQCLYSLRAALQEIDAEVWVVDNSSNDDSVSFLQPVFPEIKWILNTKNLGFSKANNQALEKATGEFILFLNPDTLLPEDCLKKCIAFMHTREDAGALGIKMLDGSGKYLPESKRGYPGLLTSFCKIAGLHHIFPNSKIFARYYLGHLPPEKNHPVEVLAGAFMLMRKKVLDVTGGFDERFFMYGEDIDLSFRLNHTPIEKSTGFWKTWYFADSSIIHFKGESTKKGSLNYVLLFYKAMIQFVQKHYASGPWAGLFKLFIYSAIAFRALASGIVRVASLLAGLILFLLKVPGRLMNSQKGKHYIDYTTLPHCRVIGSQEDFNRIKAILANHQDPYLLSADSLIEPGDDFIGNLHKKMARMNQSANEVVVFCPSPAFGLQKILSMVNPAAGIWYAFHYPGSNSIIGSNDKNKGGEMYTDISPKE
jgi:GT2 family glycosyltransferase